MYDKIALNFRRFIIHWSIFLCLIASTSVCLADPIKQVISTSPSWKTFTNQDGTGLYHEILFNIFQPLGIKIVHKYTNANRGIYMVGNDLADFYTCKNNIDNLPGLTLARHPMYEGKFHAIFKRDNIKNWQGVDSLANRKVVWRRGYYRASEFDVDIIIRETDSGVAALGQVVVDRGDFYIDDLNLIKESISKSDHTIDMDAYQIEPVGKRTYHPVFKRSVRGKQIMDLYDRGMESLHKSGKLQTIFKKWNHPFPAYDIP